ncbi:CLUMA_CG019421, isoform A [Clunio marinus]|uniref:CLUMA_CG019421, isoform A n=1 Tax=Clunio marinus TaxID=568069 RepID=A0A1J1J2A6_9DIPT|nr:CLUMA_CG019421, isoform A [Clunio marinus]
MHSVKIAFTLAFVAITSAYNLDHGYGIEVQHEQHYPAHHEAVHVEEGHSGHGGYGGGAYSDHGVESYQSHGGESYHGGDAYQSHGGESYHGGEAYHGGESHHGGEVSSDYGHDDHLVDYHAYPKYKYEYGIKDEKTGDHKSHWEVRDGDVVKGEYTVDEADGTKRIVAYTSDKHNGFNAVVKHIGEPSYHHHH